MKKKKKNKRLKYFIGDLVRFRSQDINKDESMGIIVGTKELTFGHDSMVYHKVFTIDNEILDVYCKLIKEKICE